MDKCNGSLTKGQNCDIHFDEIEVYEQIAKFQESIFNFLFIYYNFFIRKVSVSFLNKNLGETVLGQLFFMCYLDLFLEQFKLIFQMFLMKELEHNLSLVTNFPMI